ncbi:zinc-binding dehydrogenase [Pseudalkalibacillus decolorationis]|uniref:zinc-binding dehydrogenase n=1 Tax=Pseudalkalibacillus decolorationis TaxID=163879 RepID=UPI0021480483|nr:zinc-binding dehydrogenase [Pseudalkalibacillus decolorationis]
MLGTTMDSHQEFKEMLELVNKYRIKLVLDQIFPHSETADAMKRLEDSEQFGKIEISR